MSTQQFLNFRILKSLLKDLKAFGLNPHDWKLERAQSIENGEFKIHHRHDMEFRMTGHWAHRRSGVLSLRGLSISSL